MNSFQIVDSSTAIVLNSMTEEIIHRYDVNIRQGQIIGEEICSESKRELNFTIYKG